MKTTRNWTEEEFQFLIINCKNLSSKEIALRLNRTSSSINHKISELKLETGKHNPIRIGERFFRLAVIKKIERKGNYGESYYECKCDCGNVTEVVGTSLRLNRVRSCGCYQKETAGNRSRLDIKECSLNRLEQQYKAGAKNRGDSIPYELTTKEFRDLISQNCYWCGEEPRSYNAYYKSDGSRIKGVDVPEEWAKKQWILANGIDRINNDLGYIFQNCVPCCGPCNVMKGDKSEKEFMDRIHKILVFQELKVKS